MEKVNKPITAFAKFQDRKTISFDELTDALLEGLRQLPEDDRRKLGQDLWNEFKKKKN